jgi:hypothetical protein
MNAPAAFSAIAATPQYLINHVFLRALGWLHEKNATDPMDRHV